MSVTNPTPQSIVILISGGGSNMRAIVETASRRAWLARFGAEVTGVVSNQANAAGLAKALLGSIWNNFERCTIFKEINDFSEAHAILALLPIDRNNKF